MKIAIKINLILLFLILTVTCSEDHNNNAERISIPITVQVAEKTTFIDKLEYTGIIRPIKEMKLMSDIPGKVSRLYVDEGSNVRKGQLLAEMDTEKLKLILDQAVAGQRMAEANFNSAKRDWERFEKLRSEDAVSEQQAEKISLAYKSALARLEQAEASLKIAQHNYNVSIIKAPFSGIISKKYVEEGDMINPQMSMGGAAAVFSIINYSKIEVEINVAEKDIKKFKKEMKAILITNTDPDIEYFGKVETINYAADPVSRSFSVKLLFDNKDLKILPNTVGTIDVIFLEKENTFTFPLTTLIESQYVFTVKNNQAVRKKVNVGLKSETAVETLDGVSVGDSVITKGSYVIKEGSFVIVK